jgi:SAM-dependent methyltransferase
LGIDLSARRVAYACRTYRSGNLDFRVSDCTRLSLPPNSFDFVVSSNTLEHIAEPAAFLQGIAGCLAPKGLALVTVPPVLSNADIAVHRVNRYHLAPLSVRAWSELFVEHGWSVEFFAQYSSKPLDFSSPHPSSVRVTDFVFQQTSIEHAYSCPPISATYLLRRVG